MASDKTVILVTGANTGLGYEVVKALAKSSTPYEIIVGCRTVSSGDTAIEEIKKECETSSTFSTLQVDLESDSSLEKAIEEITAKHGRLDVLINNGGANFDTSIASGKMSMREAFNKSWDVNVTGTHILTHRAVPLLLKSSNPRLMFVTSGTSTLAETERFDGPMYERLNGAPEAGWPKKEGFIPITSYRSSKTGLNMLMREWEKTLRNDGVKIWCISPGLLATGLAGVGADTLRKVSSCLEVSHTSVYANYTVQMGALEPYIGGEFIRDVVEGKRDGDTGKVIRNKGVIQPW